MTFILELVLGALDVLQALQVVSIWRFVISLCAAMVALNIALDASDSARIFGFAAAGALVALGVGWEWRLSRAA